MPCIHVCDGALVSRRASRRLFAGDTPGLPLAGSRAPSPLRSRWLCIAIARLAGWVPPLFKRAARLTRIPRPAPQCAAKSECFTCWPGSEGCDPVYDYQRLTVSEHGQLAGAFQMKVR